MPSTVIRDFSYDESRNELTVSFTTGRVYVYSLIPPALAAGMGAAFSKGVFFNENIRARYPFRKAGSHSPASLLDAIKESREDS